MSQDFENTEQASLIKTWLRSDSFRMDALCTARELKLKDWCLSAGFVRNLVWDKRHDLSVPTTLNDIDFVYFDDFDLCSTKDALYEAKLCSVMAGPWSVKNQARMHIRNNDQPYHSVEDAMTYWVEVETAVGVYIEPDGSLELVAPFGLQSLFDLTITMNNKRPKPKAFRERIESKGWLKKWPFLKINTL